MRQIADGVFEVAIGWVHAHLIVVDDGVVLVDTGLPKRSAEIGRAGGVLQTSGGRVLCVVGLGDSIKMAQKQAYEAVDQIHFNGAQYRCDIGWRGLKH